MWVIDNVYIGLLCFKFCFGRGQCIRYGCKCDFGFFGLVCEMVFQIFLMFIFESFGSFRFFFYYNFYFICGVEVSFGCGVLVSGKVLVFNKDGWCQLIIFFFDSL